MKERAEARSSAGPPGPRPAEFRLMNPSRVNQDISRDLRNKSLESRPIRPLEIVHGFIFFPGEASSAKELRLQFKESGTNRFLNIALPL